MSETWYILNSGSSSAAFNMALDESLLEHSNQSGRPVLRFYGWTEPAASFGYFQRFTEIVSWTNLRPLVRRPTGGGLVPHDRDWTYSLIFPPSHGWHALRAQDSYRHLHGWIQRAFAHLNVATELAPVPRKDLPGLCFAGPERGDLLLSGQKIAGAAQRRSRRGLLIQGSIQQPPADLIRATWEKAMLQTAQCGGPIGWLELRPTSDLLSEAENLAAQKYATRAYTEKR